jgi:acyl transferase domain-containing protein
VVEQLAVQGIKAKQLAVSHAFHSPLMEPMLAEFEQVASEVAYAPPRLPLVSNLTGALATPEIATPQYWVNHIRQPVHFATGITCLDSKKHRLFLEIGPTATLATLGRSVLGRSAACTWLSSLTPGQDDWTSVLTTLQTLYLNGVAVDWAGFDRSYERQRLTLPTYPFQRQRYWFKSAEPQKVALAHSQAADNAAPSGQLQKVLNLLQTYQGSSRQEIAELLTQALQADGSTTAA